MISIQNRLIKALTLSITGLIITILLAADIAIDSWSNKQYQHNLTDNLHFLMSQIQQDETGFILHFSHLAMPEFEHSNKTKFYQIWADGKTLIQSPNFSAFPQKSLPFQALDLDEIKIIGEALPDDNQGKIIYSRYRPQKTPTSANFTEKELLIAYAQSSKAVDIVQWLIDIGFVIACFIVVIFIRFFVVRSVRYGLKPLHSLSQQIKAIDISSEKTNVSTKEPTEELLPIINSLNHFIRENRQLYLNEKRLTSDIAHELKTPIAELISLSQVFIRFPNDGDLKEDFAEQVLNIAERLNTIVSHILLLYRTHETQLPQDEAIAIKPLLLSLCQRNLNESLVCDVSPITVQSNRFALESILNNLISNAIAYSKPNTPITINARKVNKCYKIAISNQVDEHFSQDDLASLFEPLWQKDCSRSSTQHFGLGLAIVKTMAQAIEAQLNVALEHGILTFTLILES